MSSDLENRIAELLSSVRDELESESVPDDVDAGELGALGGDHDLADHAEDAREVLETNDPKAVLEAVGLAELPDGSEPSSIPEAIARGSEERVRELHALVTLASLAEWGEDEDADELEAVLSDLRETLAEGEPEVGGEEEPDGDGPSEGETPGDETDDEATDKGTPDAARGDETEEKAPDSTGEEATDEDTGNDESGSGLEDVLKTAAGTTVEEFSDDLETLRGRLESLTGDDEDAEEAEETEDEVEQEEEKIDDEADEDLFDFGDGPDGDERGGRSTRHSTMPSSRRADMRAVRRHSTMPKRH